jgi:hypothetical protein
MNAKELHQLGQSLFTKKTSLDTLHQEIADHFYPERAIFTVSRSLGNDFAANLHTSYPMLCRRDLGNQLGVMLRPTARQWFHTVRRFEEDDEDVETKRWLEAFEETQRRAMYDPVCQFTRATKEADHDFAAFGQTALSVELNHHSSVGSHLLYRCWHLKDMCWQENEAGKIETKFRKWKATVHQLKRIFGAKIHRHLEDMHARDPFAEHEVWHMVVPTEIYDGPKRKQPYMAIWYDPANDNIMREDAHWTGYYIIPRWQTVSGSQYSYSPATVAALPDARLIQAMTFTLLEASEKATNPPLIATQDAVRSDVQTYAGGITWVDQEYDEKLGEALRPLTQDFRGMQYGVAMNQEVRLLIREAFYLNKLSMPERAPEMTAYEVGQRVQEYIRNALPIFEPMEAEYNAALCEDSFELLWRNGAFGDPRSWPKTLRGAEIEFRFESPLHDAIDQQKGHKLIEAQQLLAAAAALDASSVGIFDAKKALRDALSGIQVPAEWQRSEEEVEALARKQAEELAAQQMLASMEQASNITKNLGNAPVPPVNPTGGGGAPVEQVAA